MNDISKLPLLLLATILWMPGTISAQDTTRDTTFSGRNIPLDEVVVTGTRNETDVRHLSQTVSVLNRLQIEQSQQSSLLPACPTVLPEVSPCADFQAATHG